MHMHAHAAVEDRRDDLQLEGEWRARRPPHLGNPRRSSLCPGTEKGAECASGRQMGSSCRYSKHIHTTNLDLATVHSWNLCSDDGDPLSRAVHRGQKQPNILQLGVGSGESTLINYYHLVATLNRRIDGLPDAAGVHIGLIVSQTMDVLLAFTRFEINRFPGQDKPTSNDLLINY